MKNVLKIIILLLSMYWHCANAGRQKNGAKRPNIIIIMTDDQDIQLGMYVHNHLVMSNNENCTGKTWRELHEFRTFNVYLQQAGYKTGYFGKYLNEYDGSYIPPGWDEWMGQIKNSKFYNYSINYNGQRYRHGSNYQTDYFTDLIANDSIHFIGHSKRTNRRQPLLAVLSFPAPHGPEDPAPQHAHLFPRANSHRTPTWNYAPNPDKEWIMRHTGKMEPVHVTFTDFLHRRRLQTLQSVDSAVNRVVSELRDLRELSNTYLFYTSDHGYHLGQYGLLKGKNLPYDFDIRVPFFIRGPGIQKGSVVKKVVGNIDIGPTVLDMAGLPVPGHMDGRSMLPILLETNIKRRSSTIIPNSSTEWRDTLLIERGKMPKFDKIRQRFLRQKDKYSKEMRIQKECLKSQYQAPCRPTQEWECRQNSVGRWRIFKCRGRVTIEKECACQQQQEQQQPAGIPQPQQLILNSSNSNDLKDFGELLRSRSRSKRDVELRMEQEDQTLNSTTFPADDSDGTGGRLRVFKQFDEMLLSTWEEQHPGVQADVSDSVLNAWEREFMADLLARDIRESNKWSQGIFGDDNTETAPAVGGTDDFRLRTKRSTTRVGHRNHQKKWKKHQNHLQGKINKLRRKLKSLKNVRKSLRVRRTDSKSSESKISTRPVVTKKGGNENNEKNCVCMAKYDFNSEPHPLRIPFKGYLADSELVAYNEARRSRRKKGRGSRRKSEKKKYCSIPNMNCFIHNDRHWKTAPFWPKQLGSFCFCQNANNNTYWCLRRVNEIHNWLYCEFVTGFVSFYDMNKDPHQMHNLVFQLNVEKLEALSRDLSKLRQCRGWKGCHQRSEGITIGGQTT